MEEFKSKVYILLDSEGRIIRCEGGYGMQNIHNIDEWILIDEGNGDKYNHCQTCYFEDGLYTRDIIPLYKYEGGAVVKRTEEEIEADRANLPKPEPVPSPADQIAELQAQLKAQQAVIDALLGEG